MSWAPQLLEAAVETSFTAAAAGGAAAISARSRASLSALEALARKLAILRFGGRRATAAVSMHGVGP